MIMYSSENNADNGQVFAMTVILFLGKTRGITFV